MTEETPGCVLKSRRRNTWRTPRPGGALVLRKVVTDHRKRMLKPPPGYRSSGYEYVACQRAATRRLRALSPSSRSSSANSRDSQSTNSNEAGPGHVGHRPIMTRALESSTPASETMESTADISSRSSMIPLPGRRGVFLKSTGLSAAAFRSSRTARSTDGLTSTRASTLKTSISGSAPIGLSTPNPTKKTTPAVIPAVTS